MTYEVYVEGMIQADHDAFAAFIEEYQPAVENGSDHYIFNFPESANERAQEINDFLDSRPCVKKYVTY